MLLLVLLSCVFATQIQGASVDCGPHAEYKRPEECPSPTCQTDNAECDLDTPACYCDEGYIKNDDTGECVLEEDCPKDRRRRSVASALFLPIEIIKQIILVPLRIFLGFTEQAIKWILDAKLFGAETTAKILLGVQNINQVILKPLIEFNIFRIQLILKVVHFIVGLIVDIAVHILRVLVKIIKFKFDLLPITIQDYFVKLGEILRDFSGKFVDNFNNFIADIVKDKKSFFQSLTRFIYKVINALKLLTVEGNGIHNNYFNTIPPAYLNLPPITTAGSR